MKLNNFSNYLRYLHECRDGGQFVIDVNYDEFIGMKTGLYGNSISTKYYDKYSCGKLEHKETNNEAI